jgi:hypothetical protein
MFPKIAISIERKGAAYVIHITEPQVEREFFDEVSIAHYLARKFTMRLEEAHGILRKAVGGRCVVTALPILPENIPGL